MQKSLLDNKTSVRLSAIFVALLTFAIYLPVMKNGFVNWDDDLYVYENPNIESIDLDFFKWSFTSKVASLWHPLTLFSLALDYTLWGPSPWGFHLTNIILHALNTLLVFILTTDLIAYAGNGGNKCGKNNIIAGTVTALLFGIHPLHVESVAWVSERKDVLSAFFFLLSLIFYLKYACNNSKRSAFYIVCLTSFILALTSKPMAISLPFVLLILDYFPFKRLKTTEKVSVLIEKLPFVLLSLLMSTITIWASYSGGALKSLETYPFMMRIFTVIKAYGLSPK